MPKQVLIIQHAAPETLARSFTEALREQGFELSYLKVFESAPAYDRFSPDEGDAPGLPGER